jgi:hypothetical protein
MEMPKNCWVCPFGLDGYIWNENDARTLYVRFCSRHSGEEFHVSEIETIDRPWYCDSFVCQLPEGHGRLVDIDKPFLNVLKTCMGTAKYQATIAERLDMCSVLNVEIIVPAEAERSEA